MPDTPPVFDVPRCEGIEIDGNTDDWGQRGFRVELLASPDGSFEPAGRFRLPADFDPSFRLGWDDEGLLVFVDVRDNAGCESDVDLDYYYRDCVMPYVAETVGSANFYGMMISPGVDPQHPDVRTKQAYIGADPSAERAFHSRVARTKAEGGYCVEILLPWSDLNITPKEGDVLGFQLIVSDMDTRAGKTPFVAAWFPNIGTVGNPNLMHRIRLAQQPSRVPVVLASAAYRRFRETLVTLVAPNRLLGQPVAAELNSQPWASGSFVEKDGRAVGELAGPFPQQGEGKQLLAIKAGGQRVTDVVLPDPRVEMARQFLREEIVFEPYCFAGMQLPSCDFEHPLEVERLIGPYRINVTYYDANGAQVTVADKPGRYGAVVEIVPEQGRTTHRFRTLYHAPAEVDWWRAQPKAEIEFPAALGIAPEVVAKQAPSVSNVVKLGFGHQLDHYPVGATLLAGLKDIQDAQTTLHDPEWIDRQWWVDFKRRYYGIDKVYDKPFVCPKPKRGKSAPVVREGTVEEAGMDPAGVERIDALCREWAADSDEAFAVCIVRHGVIALHKAYGMRDGAPMTLETKSWMASITKLMSGTLMMELVDQGLVDLDGRVDRYLPAFRGIEVARPLTVRNLYNHTGGLWDHWGDDLHDFEEVIADYYPLLEVGQRHEYNGAGNSLGGKIIETISGEAVPVFYRKHLLDPLGCPNTEVSGSSGDARSVPLDIAKIGQMLLNRGAYGDMRFFSEETFEKMLPRSLKDVLGPDTTLEWGVGTVWFKDLDPDARTFGHGAASAATLRIDLDNDLVVVQTRNTAGTNFSKYSPMFLKSVVAAIDKKA